MLDEAEASADASALIDQALEMGTASAQVLTRAAALLQQLGRQDRAHELLERAVMLDAPPAPTQLALAESFRARGDLEKASQWLRGAMLRARPDAALLLELATIEPVHADALARAALHFQCRDTARAIAAGDLLLDAGQRRAARIAYDIALAAGVRAAPYLLRHSALVADPSVCDDPPLPAGPLGMPYRWHVGSAAAQMRLTAAYPRDEMVAHAKLRENSPRWLDLPALRSLLAGRIAERKPFSWIRLSDGEARFLLHMHSELQRGLPEREGAAMAHLIWFNWFGQEIGQVPADQLAALDDRLARAIGNADLLGLTSAERLAGDDILYGFLAALEHHVEPLLRSHPEIALTDTGLNLAVNAADPFLASLIGGLDFLGVISPHPELAGRLQRHLGIGAVSSYDIPGEGRLARPRERTDRGMHFPKRYQELLAELDVPRTGAVFLVAAGLLGKIYCDEIKRKGGIALDIGALADAWMGHNTRGNVLDQAMQRQLAA